jgi:hypothetical protein
MLPLHLCLLGSWEYRCASPHLDLFQFFNVIFEGIPSGKEDNTHI